MNKIGNTIILPNIDNTGQSFPFSKTFRKSYLDFTYDKTLVSLPVLITDLLFQIMFDLRNSMFHADNTYIYNPHDKRKNQAKLELWNDEVINNEKNELKKIYKTSFFLKNRDKQKMTDA